MAVDWRNVGTTGLLLLAIGAVALWRIADSNKTGRKGHVVEGQFEVDELGDKVIVQQLFDVARGEIFGLEATGPTGLEGRKVFLCAYRDGPLPPCGIGDDADLAVAVRKAATALHEEWPGIVEEARLKMDFSVSEEAVTFPATDVTDHDVGVYGYLVERFEGSAVLTPSDVLEASAYTGGEGQKAGIKPKFLAHKLKRRNPRIGELDHEKGFDYTRIRTTSWVENAERDGIFRTYRMHKWEYPEVEPDVLLQSAVWAADYLLASISADGRLRYLYDPTYDRVIPGYNLLRHGGTTYSLLQAYERTGFEPYRTGSEAAIGFLLQNTKVDERHGPFGGGQVRYVVESKHIKLGGAGLGLVMLAQYQLATGEETYVEEANQLALFLVSQQKKDGEFIYFAPKVPGESAKDDISAYYPGEAILGLSKQYALDGNPLWLDTAERGAKWLIEVRDAGKTPQRLANDHWLMIAMSHLYEITSDETYLKHSLSLAQAVRFQQDKHKSHVQYHRDYAGGYYQPPRSTPAATRGEGLVAVLDTCKLAKLDCGWVADLLSSTVQHELQCQYSPDQAWWVKNPATALGAFHGGIIDIQIRNDYTQHNLSSILGTERHLRASQVALPGGPSWKPEDARRFTGIAGEKMGELRKGTRAARPPTQWEEQQNAAEDSIEEE